MRLFTLFILPLVAKAKGSSRDRGLRITLEPNESCPQKECTLDEIQYVREEFYSEMKRRDSGRDDRNLRVGREMSWFYTKIWCDSWCCGFPLKDCLFYFRQCEPFEKLIQCPYDHFGWHRELALERESTVIPDEASLAWSSTRDIPEPASDHQILKLSHSDSTTCSEDIEDANEILDSLIASDYLHDDCKCILASNRQEECIEVREECPNGWKRDIWDLDYCVKVWCDESFRCPEGSKRKEGRECYNNADDCECSGRSKVMHNGQCLFCDEIGERKMLDDHCVMDWCYDNFQCPFGSQRKEDRDCYNDFNDCECLPGYRRQIKDGIGYCVIDSCLDDYMCPPNSSRIEGQQCYDSFNDCSCDPGYHPVGDKCEANYDPCDDKQKFVSGYCVELDCRSDFQCPPNSHRKDKKKCYESFKECECDEGFKEKKDDNKVYYCEPKKSSSSSSSSD